MLAKTRADHRWRDIQPHLKAATDAETHAGSVQRATAGTQVLSLSSRFGRRRNNGLRLAALVDKGV